MTRPPLKTAGPAGAARTSVNRRVAERSVVVVSGVALSVALPMLAAFSVSCGDITTDLIIRDPNASAGASGAGGVGSMSDMASVIAAGGALECQRDDECSPERARCDTSSNRCVACLEPNDCGEGRTCNLPSHACVVRCTAGAGCAGNAPFCDEATGACRACLADSECVLPARHCELATGRCVECLTVDDCQGGEAPLCSPTGRCVECLSDGHCEDENERCSPVLGECGVPCSSPGTCLSDDPVCDVAVGFCVECSEDDDCGDDRVCRNFDCIESDSTDEDVDNDANEQRE